MRCGQGGAFAGEQRQPLGPPLHLDQLLRGQAEDRQAGGAFTPVAPQRRGRRRAEQGQHSAAAHPVWGQARRQAGAGTPEEAASTTRPPSSSAVSPQRASHMACSRSSAPRSAARSSASPGPPRAASHRASEQPAGLGAGRRHQMACHESSRWTGLMDRVPASSRSDGGSSSNSSSPSPSSQRW